MLREKLKKYRLQNNFSHRDLAEVLCLSPTNYTRRENGETKIALEEWKKLAEKLQTPIENIYEADEGMVFIFNDNATENGNIVNNYNIPLSMWETQKKYIEKLEQENQILTLQNLHLKKDAEL